MTRADIEKEFTVEGNRIVSPGPYQGEPVWVPYFRALGAHGDWSTYIPGREDGVDSIMIFTVHVGDRKEFPELEFIKSVRLEQRSDGTVVSNFDYRS